NHLKKGNLTPVIFTEKGLDQKRLIAANPKYKNIDVYDESGKHLFHTKMKQEKPTKERSDKKKTTAPKKDGEKADKQQAPASAKAKKPRTRVPVEKAGK